MMTDNSENVFACWACPYGTEGRSKSNKNLSKCFISGGHKAEATEDEALLEAIHVYWSYKAKI